MRKILLASASIVVMAAPAFAAGSDSVTVTTTVQQSCTVDIPNSSVTLPVDASPSASTPLSYTCNFVGEVETATLTFSSLNLGVGNSSHPYSVTPSTLGSGTSAAPFNSVGGVTTPN